jgi:hypothetical protein
MKHARLSDMIRPGLAGIILALMCVTCGYSWSDPKTPGSDSKHAVADEWPWPRPGPDPKRPDPDSGLLNLDWLKTELRALTAKLHELIIESTRVIYWSGVRDGAVTTAIVLVVIYLALVLPRYRN